MAKPRFTGDYPRDITEASRSVLAEEALALAGYRDALVLIGGWAPYFLLETQGEPGTTFRHVGSIDIDWVVDPNLVDEERYATIVKLLLDRGHEPASGSLYQLERRVTGPGGRNFIVRTDFLTPAPLAGKGRSHRHRKVQRDLKARTLPGAEVALLHRFEHLLRARLLGGGNAEVPIQVADVVAILALKGVAMGERYAEKDAYDTYAVTAYDMGGPAAIAMATRPFLDEEPVAKGLAAIAQKFRAPDAEGPAWVAAFLEGTEPEANARARQDAYMTVHEVLRLCGVG